MKNNEKTREQLIEEVEYLEYRLAEFEKNITYQNKIENQLRESEEILKILINTYSEPTFLIDLEGTVLFANEAAIKTLNSTDEEFVGNKIYNFFSTELVESRKDFFFQVLETKQKVTFTDVQDKHVIEHNLYPVFNKNGEITKVAIFCKDITTLMNKNLALEEALEKSEEIYRTIVENTGHIIFYASSKGIFTYLSPQINLLGYRPEELIGHHMLDIVHPEDKTQEEKNLEKIIKGEMVFTKVRIKTKENRYNYMEGFSKSVIDGNDIHILGVFDDITEKKRLEDQLNNSQKMEAIGKLASSIAHDFNNFLTAILGYTSIIFNHVKQEDPVYNYLKEIQKTTERGANLTNQLLSLGRKRTQQTQTVKLNSLINDMNQMLIQLISENILIEFDLDKQLYSIKADSCQLTQVIINLIVNSKDAMPKGGKIKIRTKNIFIDENNIKSSKKFNNRKIGKFATLSIEDNGTGMDKETLDCIFEPFFTTKDFGKGTGLGLSIVYNIIKQHDGWVEVSSTLGAGTTFTIFFPVIE